MYSPVVGVYRDNFEISSRVNSRVATTHSSNLFSSFVTYPFLPVSRSDIENPLGSLRVGTCRSRERVDRCNVTV